MIAGVTDVTLNKFKEQKIGRKRNGVGKKKKEKDPERYSRLTNYVQCSERYTGAISEPAEYSHDVTYAIL